MTLAEFLLFHLCPFSELVTEKYSRGTHYDVGLILTSFCVEISRVNHMCSNGKYKPNLNFASECLVKQTDHVKLATRPNHHHESNSFFRVRL